MIEPTYQDDEVTLYCADCLDVLPQLAAGSVDCAIIDPPYYRIVAEDWDNVWNSIEDYQAWIKDIGLSLRRVMSDKGSVYIFQDDKGAAYSQVVLDRIFLLLNNLVWHKTNNLPQKNTEYLRSYAPMTERILFYSCQYDPTGWETVKLDMNNFQTLREYFKQYQDALGLGIKQINATLGHRKAEHAFYWNSTQWDLPTSEVYAELGKIPSNHGFVRREYEDLRREYEDLRREYEDLRRVFNATKKTTDVINGPIVSISDNTDHPTTKPLWLIKRLVVTSTNPGDTIIDFTMGSGTTGVACAQLGRKFIGIEIDPKYYAIAEKRIRLARQQLRLNI